MTIICRTPGCPTARRQSDYSCSCARSNLIYAHGRGATSNTI